MKYHIVADKVRDFQITLNKAEELKYKVLEIKQACP